jgi:hypothetical protein
MCFFFFKFQELFDVLPYLFYDPLIVEKRVVQPSIVYVFSVAAFAVEF